MSMTASRLTRAAATLLLAPVALLGAASAPSPAHAAPEDRLLVSHDGAHFAPSSTASLFTSIGAVAPGDALRESVWLRNAAVEDGALAVSLEGVTADDADLAAATTLRVTGPGIDATATIADAVAAGGRLELAADEPLPAGGTVRLDAELAVSPSLGDDPVRAGNAGAQGRIEFELFATLVQTTDSPVDPAPDPDPEPPVGPDPEAPGAPGGEQPPGGGLPITGAAGLAALPAIALGAAGVGALLAAAGRRRRERGEA